MPACVPFFLWNFATRQTVVSANCQTTARERQGPTASASYARAATAAAAMSTNRKILILQLALVAAIISILLFIALSR